MHWSLGNTARGLIATALAGDAAAILSAWNATTTWHEAIGVVGMSIFVLAGALIDPGSKPAKA